MNGNGTTSGNQTTWTAVDATNLVGGVNSGFTLLRSAPNNVGGYTERQSLRLGENSANENMGATLQQLNLYLFK
jgi:hypothetical protein